MKTTEIQYQEEYQRVYDEMKTKICPFSIRADDNGEPICCYCGMDECLAFDKGYSDQITLEYPKCLRLIYT